MPGGFAVWKLVAPIPATGAEQQVTLPKDTLVKIIATPVGSSVVEVEWEKKRFFVSRRDLVNNGERVRANRHHVNEPERGRREGR